MVTEGRRWFSGAVVLCVAVGGAAAGGDFFLIDPGVADEALAGPCAALVSSAVFARLLAGAGFGVARLSADAAVVTGDSAGDSAGDSVGTSAGVDAGEDWAAAGGSTMLRSLGGTA